MSGLPQDIWHAFRRRVRAPAFTMVVILVLAVGIGMNALYGVVSDAVAPRTREMGLRIARGAAPGDVVRLVVASPVRLAVGGAALGLVAAVLPTWFVGAPLYETKAMDPFVLTAATLTLIAVAMLAARRPARRATRVDPAIAAR